MLRPRAIFFSAYLEFIFERLRDKNPDGSLQIMYTIHGELLDRSLVSLLYLPQSGEKHIPEIELTHLDGHKGSKPVRIGNGAADHKQLVSLFFCFTWADIEERVYQDIYGEL